VSLSSILDDIQEDAVNSVQTENSTEPLVVQDRALEHLQGLAVVFEQAKTLGEYVHMQRAFKGILSTPTVDKTSALELFTMLPLQSEDAPILTSVPSEHNRGVLVQAQRKAQVKDAELVSFTHEVCGLIEKSLPVAKELTAVCDAYLVQIKAELSRLYDNVPTVVVDGANVNLLE
jgi:hypothetical protein